MSTFYNEWEPFATQWLRNLVKAGGLPEGDVSDADIRTIGDGLGAYQQAHFFAGIGGWPLALKLAGWPDDVVTWTGSCPCQPFSAAGRRGGFDDARHLWPDWFKLVVRHRPQVVFGEQVASPDGLAWWDVVLADLEGAGYTCAAFDLCAPGVGAPHIRQRLYWVAYSDRALRAGERVHVRPRGSLPPLSDADGSGAGSGLGDPSGAGGRRDAGAVSGAEAQGSGERVVARDIPDEPFFAGPVEWLPCGDGKARPVEPGLAPLVERLPGHVGQIRAYGNAVCVPLAVEFILAVMDTLDL